MTITYQYRVANVTLGTFAKLLACWRGSVYKLVYKEMIIFSTMYAAISLVYRLGLNEYQRTSFELIAQYCNHYTSLIPVSFVLGFYVTLIVQRWWTQFQNVPWPDRTIFLMCTYLHGLEEKSKIMRRTVARYMMFGLILICRSISVAVMKRFPTLDHIVESGFISKEEAIMYEGVDCKYNKFWVPLMWANNVLVQARRENKIETDWGLRMVIQQLADFRDKCSLCFVYDWITIPLVYTQVVTLAVYTFFGACLVGRQFLDPSKKYPGFEYDLYVPVFTLLQFFFYMGWLKVAEQLINPFGEDDDDYDINWLLDRHMAVVMTLVDQMYGKYPPLLKDLHFHDAVTELPYTEASMGSRRPMFLGSTYNLESPSFNEQRIVLPDELHDNAPGLRRRTTSYLAGSVLNLFGNRHSGHGPHGRPNYRTSDDNFSQMDFLMYTDSPVERNPTRPESRKGSTFSSWASESDVRQSRISEDEFLGRQRSKTDADEGLVPEVEKEPPRRKRSFPLSLLRKLTSSSGPRNSGVESPKPKRKENASYTEHIPEYVPLRRARVKSEETRKLSSSSSQGDRKRKTSYPLGLFRKQMLDVDSGSTLSVPEVANGKTKTRVVRFDPDIHLLRYKPPARMRSYSTNSIDRRFTVEHIPDSLTLPDNSLHKRNAQKIEKALSSGKVVSRAPDLSAIEEGNTINSLSQVMVNDDVRDDVFASRKTSLIDESIPIIDEEEEQLLDVGDDDDDESDEDELESVLVK